MNNFFGNHLSSVYCLSNLLSRWFSFTKQVTIPELLEILQKVEIKKWNSYSLVAPKAKMLQKPQTNPNKLYSNKAQVALLWISACNCRYRLKVWIRNESWHFSCKRPVCHQGPPPMTDKNNLQKVIDSCSELRHFLKRIYTHLACDCT